MGELTLADLDAIFDEVYAQPTNIVISNRTYRYLKRFFRQRYAEAYVRQHYFSHMTNKQYKRILTGRFV